VDNPSPSVAEHEQDDEHSEGRGGSPWIRGAPQDGLASDIWSIRSRTSLGTRGLPTSLGRLFHLHARFMVSRLASSSEAFGSSFSVAAGSSALMPAVPTASARRRSCSAVFSAS
jgi:hypothetical protein